MPGPSHINILPDAVARKIAAGEVIERPQSVVRELLDNSLDAGAGRIDIHLEAGGNDLIRVTDDGHGMAREDLERCYLPHATSKIATEDDLQFLRTLGFRGEALSSMAAVSRLTVTSLAETSSDATAHRIEVRGGKLVGSGPSAGDRGTTVEVANIFYNVPARKRFLKRAQSETTMVKTVLLDKALAFPEVAFRMYSGNDLRVVLPPASRIERISAAYPERTEPSLLHSLEGSGEGFTFQIIAGEPAAARKDRKQLQVFVNHRRIWEYALVQAMEYPYRDYVHGGLFPVAYLYLDIDPDLVDFNIHPAKREARFRALPDIHRRIVDVIGSYLHAFDRAHRHPGYSSDHPALSGLDEVADRRPAGWSPVAPDARATVHRPARNVGSSASYDLSRSFELPEESDGEFRYLGQLFGLFLVVERGDSLYLVDQHAAHERIIYERLTSGPAAQELLFPVAFETEPAEADVIAQHSDELAGLGVQVRRTGPGSWELVSIPAAVQIETDGLIEMIRELAARPSDFSRDLYASMSCRAAVMDGDPLSRATAIRIITDSLDLVNARCPHGRPIWAEFTRDDLAKLVGRI